MATQSQLIQLTIALYNAAPGADVLAELTALNNAGASLKDLAEALDNTATYKALYPDTLTNAEFATAFVNTYIGTEASELAKADLVTWTLATLNGGESRGATMQIINDALAGSNEARWADAKQAFLNKTEVAEFYSVTQALSGATVAELQGSIASVTSDAASVIAAKAGLTPQVAGEKFNLTSGTDRGADFAGTADNDQYNAFLQQNSFSGGVSNSLSSADKLDGGAGTDSLYAEIVPEFFGATGNNQIDIQARTANIENVQFEARDVGINLQNTTTDTLNTTITVDAKNMLDIDKIGSYMSDGDLVIENLTTQQSEGGERNTSDITITMDHTDNYNSDGDASDLTVYFDEDYLLAGQSTSASRANYFLLDEDSTDIANMPLLNLDKAGIIFTIDGVSYTVAMADAVAGPLDTYAEFAAGLQTALDAMVAGGETALAGLNIVVDPAITIVETAITIGGVAQAITIPAISVIDSQGRDIQPTGFADTNDQTGQFNTVGRFNNETATTSEDPVSVNVELNKVGREGEGGDLTIGGKELDSDNQGSAGNQDQGKGIEVFNIDVLGDATKLSNLGSINSTNDALKTVNIKTGAAFANGATFASLTVRDAFNDSDDIETVNANGFKGDLDIGEDTAALNVDTFTATGGGEVTYNAKINDTDGGKFTVTTGAADDTITVELDGDAIDTTGTSFDVNAGNGENTVTIDMDSDDRLAGDNDNDGASEATMALLDHLNVKTGSGEDKITNEGVANLNIESGAASDFVHISTLNDSGSTSALVAQQQITDLNLVATGNGDWLVSEVVNATVTTGGVTTTVSIVVTNDNQAGITDLLSAAINGIPGVSAASLGADDIRITADVAGTAFTVSSASPDTVNGGIGQTPFQVNQTGGSASVGEWITGDLDGTGATTFADRVLYEAKLTVNFAGFEEEVTVITTAPNNFIATQLDINTAIKKAIDDNPELARLLKYEDSTGSQQLNIESTVEGNNDLAISLFQPELITTGTPTATQALFAAGDLTAIQVGLIETTANDSVATDSAAKVTAIVNTIDGFLTETGAVGNAYDVLATNDGTNGDDEATVENFSTIDMGTGTNDLVVLNSDDASANTLDFTAKWDKVSVVNFFDSEAVATDNTTALGANLTEGDHIIDFTFWLDDQTDASTTNTNGLSAVRVPTANGAVANANSDLTLASNEVVIINDFAQATATTGTFAAMTEADLDAVLTLGTTYGSMSTASSAVATVNLVGAAATQDSIIMIQNDLNAGEYKVFNVETTDAGATEAFEVTLIGTIDFGAEIDNNAVFA